MGVSSSKFFPVKNNSSGQSGYGARGSGMMQSDRGNPGYQQRFQEPLQERLAGSEDEFY